VFQRGGYKDNHQKYIEACAWMVDQLTSRRMRNTLQIRIELRATKLDKGTNGEVFRDIDGSKSTKEFRIVLHRDKTFKMNLDTLAHEVIHIIQIVTKRYQIRYWKTDGKIHARWEGNDLGPKYEIPYRERPWEQEAFEFTGDLAGAYLMRNGERRSYFSKRSIKQLRNIISGK